MPKATVRSFVEKILPNTNYQDAELAEMVYLGILRTILSELREKGVVILPEFGTFKVYKHKGRRAHDISTGGMIQVPEMNTVKFSPGYKLREYFRRT